MLTDYNSRFPGDAHGLGFELDQRWYMGRLGSPATAGHTGFTGTTMVIDPESRSIALQFSNRCHPTRNWGSTNPARRAAAGGLADAMAVRAPGGVPSWYSGIDDATTATLTVSLAPRGGPAAVRYDTFVDTEPGSDFSYLESSTDGGASWQAVPVAVNGPGAPQGPVTTLSGGTRSWWQASAQLPVDDSPLLLRWRYTTDREYTGRGVNVANVRVHDSHGLLLDGNRDPEAFTAQNWTLTLR